MSNFENELRDLINCHSKENDSNTPDYILAKYLGRCLDSFTIAIRERENWYGRKDSPAQTGEVVSDEKPESEYRGIGGIGVGRP